MKNIVLIFAAALILSACRATPKECAPQDIRQAEILHLPVKYPRYSEEMYEEGQVKLQFIVRPDGTASNIKILRSSGHSRLDVAARRSLLQAKFRPATCHGKPIAMRLTIPIIFTLK